MQQRKLFIPPVALIGTLATTILEGGTTAESGNTGYTAVKTRLIIRHIRIVNTTAGALAVSLFVGAAAAATAGTEFAFSAYSVAANSYVDWYGELILDATTPKALCGGSTTTGLTINFDNCEIGFA
jgi:hypothetical protein